MDPNLQNQQSATYNSNNPQNLNQNINQQQINQNQPPPNTNKKISSKLILIVLLIVFVTILILGAVAYFFLQNNDNNSDNTPNARNSNSNSNTENVVADSNIPSDWIQFTSVDSAFSIAYPPDTSIECEESSRCYIHALDQSTGGEIPIVISNNTIEAKYYDDEEDFEYDEELEFLKILKSIEEGEDYTYEEFDDNFTISRNADIQLNSITAKDFSAYSNASEEPSDRIFIVSMNGNEYLIIGTYEDSSQEIVDKILLSFNPINTDTIKQNNSNIQAALGEGFSNAEVKFKYNNFVEGSATFISPEEQNEEFPLEDLNRFYAVYENNEWNIIWKQAYEDEKYDQCIASLDSITSPPYTFNCYFDDYPSELFEI